jgi:hypothetical protein
MLTFEYEFLIFSPELKTSYEGANKGNIDGVRPLSTRTSKEGRIVLKRKLMVRHTHQNKL